MARPLRGASAWRLAAARLGVLLLAVACMAALGEGAVRLLYGRQTRPELEFTRYSLLFKEPGPAPDLPFQHRPHRSAELMGVVVRTNAEGLRGAAVSRAKAPETFRVACLGDSLTFGWGVREEKTYCTELARRLSVRPPADGVARAEGLNFGVGNYNTVMELAVLRGKVFAYRPDLVVVQYYVNDAEPVPGYTHRPFLGQSYLAVLVWARVDLLFRQVGLRQDYVRYYRDLYAPDRPGLQAFRAAIRGLARECRERGVPLVVVLFPELHRLDPDEPFQEVYGTVQAWWESEGVPVVNLWPRLRGQDPRQFWVHPIDVHPNARAHAVAAAGLEEFVRR